MKIIFKLLKFIFTLLGIAIFVVGGYVGYVLLQYNRIEDNRYLATENNTKNRVALNTEYSISTYNIGFGAVCNNFTCFF